MSNAILAFPDYVQADPAFATVSFSGGFWSADLPLANLLNPHFAFVSRSENLAPASTQMWVDLGVVRDARVVAVPKCNVTTGAQFRVRAFATMDATGTPQADSGWQDAYPDVYPFDSLYWGHPSLWDGKRAPEDAARVAPPVVYVAPAAVIARYWLIEFSDVDNPAGYIEVARVVVAPGWQPPRNMAYGGSLGVEDSSIVTPAIGGGEFFDVRVKRRVARITFAALADDDAMALGYEIQAKLGTTGQLYFIHNPEDAQNRDRRCFLARMRALSPIQYAAFGINSQAFELQEVVA